ncbi:hypothetical protein [Ancylobacter mangrovi]|uniref:hypothetical protein n=1 Tax=Ancylobacter mangrovi TaxID=2972472 RepID=UPI00216274BD|nr:hypothetical protein [Ancylobacter mangrovi]MCS0501388.1 hypothetical protein [Ancylobacter mangrovi]
MTDMTIDEIDTAIAELEAVRRARLLGQQATEVSYSGVYSAKFTQASAAEINQEIVRLKLRRGRLAGSRGEFGPVMTTFGRF